MTTETSFSEASAVAAVVVAADVAVVVTSIFDDLASTASNSDSGDVCRPNIDAVETST